MLEHIIFVSRGASNDTALTMRARTWGEILAQAEFPVHGFFEKC